MKKYKCLLLALPLLSALVACRGTLEIGMEQTPRPATSVPTPTLPLTNLWPLPDSGLVYLREGMIYLLNDGDEQPIGSLPDDAGYLALGPRYTAYIQGNKVQAINLSDGTTRVLLEFPNRLGQDFDLLWSSDGSALAYAMAWSEPDGSRMVELGTTDGYQQKVLGTVVARPAGPTPTPPAEPPAPPEQGFDNLHILAFDRAAGRLVTMPVGGQDGKGWIWAYDLTKGQRVQEQRWPTLEVPPLVPTLSSDLAHLAAAVPGSLQIYQADDLDVSPSLVELPAATHATSLCWSPDGQRLAYLLNEGTAPGFEVSPSLSIWVWEADTGLAHQVTPAISPEAMLHGWTADGKAIVLEALDGISLQRTVSLVDVATGQAKSLSLPEGSRVLGWIGGTPEV